MQKLLDRLGRALADHLAILIIVATVVVCAAFIATGTRSDDGSITLDGKNAQYTEAQERAFCELENQRDEAVAGLLGINVPQDAGSGCQPTDLAQMGSIPYYKVDVSTPAAFYNAVNGRGFNEGYGLQCVAGFKEFMYSLSGKVVATKTGGASGYASQQAQIEPLGFKWHGGAAGLKDGDWGIFGGGQYGHVAMYYQGKWFGQNQGAANASAGNAFNLMALGTSNLIGYYRPNIYQAVAPAPQPSPQPSKPSTGAQSNASSYTVRRGDTLGQILLDQGWTTGSGLWGVNGDAARSARLNNILNPNLIYPGQVVRK